MANITNRDTGGHDLGMTRAGSVVRSGAGWVVDGISGPRSVFNWGCHHLLQFAFKYNGMS